MMRKVFVLLMVLLATTGIVLAEDITTDKLTVQATVSGETRIAFTSNDLNGNVGNFTKFTDNENDMWESDPTYSDIVIYASAITNQRGALALTLKGSALTKMSGENIATDDQAASASLNVSIEGVGEPIEFDTPASIVGAIPADEKGITFTVINAGTEKRGDSVKLTLTTTELQTAAAGSYEAYLQLSCSPDY